MFVVSRLRTTFRRFHEDRNGGMSLMLLGLMFFIMFMALIMMEVMRYYETYNRIEISIQRSLTAAVEMNMDYRYRADRILYLYIDDPPRTAPGNYEWNLNQGKGAYVDFLDFFETDMTDFGADRSGTSFTKLDKDGELLFTVRILSHGGDDQIPCGTTSYIQKNFPDSPECPVMWVKGEIIMAPLFPGIAGDEPIVTEFTYESKNFRLDGY